jgi:hypothetical protein
MAIHEPGWYPDPNNSLVRRYFNGTEWTDLPEPPPIATTVSSSSPSSPSPSPTQPVAGDPRTALGWAVVGGGALLSIGTLLAWMTASLGIISVSRNAFQMGSHDSMTADGPIVLVLGLIILAIGVTRLTNTSMPSYLQRSPIIAGLGAAVVLGFDYHSIQQWAQSINSTYSLASVGAGFWVCCVGDAIAIVAGFGLRRNAHRDNLPAPRSQL